MSLRGSSTSILLSTLLLSSNRDKSSLVVMKKTRILVDLLALASMGTTWMTLKTKISRVDSLPTQKSMMIVLPMLVMMMMMTMRVRRPHWLEDVNKIKSKSKDKDYSWIQSLLLLQLTGRLRL